MDALDATLSRRLAARALDGLWLLPGGALLWRYLAALTDISWAWQMASFALATATLQLALEPFFLRVWGATPGKALLGLGVVDAARGQPLPALSALGRTVKVIVLGFGCWFPPLMVLTLTAALLRTRSKHGLPWDHDRANGTVQHRAPRRWRALGLMGIGLVPGWILPISAVLIGYLVMGARGLDTSQDIARALTGRWQWLHRASGDLLTLDARWRLQHEWLSLKRGKWNVVFAFGAGEVNRVLLDLDARAPSLSPCARKRLDMEDEGFVFLSDTFVDASRCVAAGGKASASGLYLVQVEGYRHDGLDHTITQVYQYGQPEAREAVQALARQLTAALTRVDMHDGRLRHHHWRNDVTGVVARLPGDWEHHERTVNDGGSISFTFQPIGGGEPKFFAALVALPWTALQTTDRHGELERRAGKDLGWRVLGRREMSANETITDAETDNGLVHLWSQEHPFITWVAIWGMPSGSPQQGDPMQHPVLRELLPTTR